MLGPPDQSQWHGEAVADLVRWRLADKRYALQAPMVQEPSSRTPVSELGERDDYRFAEFEEAPDCVQCACSPSGQWNDKRLRQCVWDAVRSCRHIVVVRRRGHHGD